ncbi:MAG: hypothetical protein LBH55_02680 [Mycoplasmataceae bacterium]|nr:hypothetical protein [Mycoplasmataceae bacterium]
MKRLIKNVKEFVIKKIKGLPIKAGSKLLVQVENVYEEVKTHKKVKKNNRKNKQPAWFKEFVDTVFLPTIAEIKERLDRNNIF